MVAQRKFLGGYLLGFDLFDLDLDLAGSPLGNPPVGIAFGLMPDTIVIGIADVVAGSSLS